MTVIIIIIIIISAVVFDGKDCLRLLVVMYVHCSCLMKK